MYQKQIVKQHNLMKTINNLIKSLHGFSDTFPIVYYFQKRIAGKVFVRFWLSEALTFEGSHRQDTCRCDKYDVQNQGSLSGKF